MKRYLHKIDTATMGNRYDMTPIFGVKLMDNYGELKRLYVSPNSRGKNVAVKIIENLESDIKISGLEYARLETGVNQKEAINLFKKMGYREYNPFDKYTEDPLSIFMKKT